jgi:hypothetical protein
VRRTPGLGSGKGKHRLTDPIADAREDLEPVAGSQLGA